MPSTDDANDGGSNGDGDVIDDNSDSMDPGDGEPTDGADTAGDEPTTDDSGDVGGVVDTGDDEPIPDEPQDTDDPTDPAGDEPSPDDPGDTGGGGGSGGGGGGGGGGDDDDCPGGFTLTVDLITTGAGEVTLDPSGECYAAGTEVTLTALANTTYTFVGFTGGGVDGVPPATVTMDADKTVTATFAGNLFIATDDTVLEFDAVTGEFVREVVASGAGSLSDPLAIAFGPSGDLFVTAGIGEVLRFDGTTGATLGTFVAIDDGELGAAFGIAFGPNGNLFVADGNQVLEFDGATGAAVGVFALPDAGGLNDATAVRFASEGDLLVANAVSGSPATNVLDFDGDTGEFVTELVTTESAVGDTLDFTPGPDGDLFIAETATGMVKRFNGGSGDPVACPCDCINPCPDPALPDSEYAISGLNFPSSLAFAPDDSLLVTSGGTVRAFTIADEGPIERPVFIDSTDDEQFDISDVAFLGFKPLP